MGQSVVIHCSKFDDTDDGESVAAWLASKAGVAPPVSVRWHNGSLYATFPDEVHAKQLVEIAVADGLEVHGEMASVESLSPDLLRMVPHRTSQHSGGSRGSRIDAEKGSGETQNWNR